MFENKTAQKDLSIAKDLQDQLGAELRAYAQQHGMNPPERGPLLLDAALCGWRPVRHGCPSRPLGRCRGTTTSRAAILSRRSGWNRPSPFRMLAIRTSWLDRTIGEPVIPQATPPGSNRDSKWCSRPDAKRWPWKAYSPRPRISGIPRQDSAAGDGSDSQAPSRCFFRR